MFKRLGPLCLILSLAWPVFAQQSKPAAQGPAPALVVTAPVEAARPRIPRTFIGTAEPRYSAAVATEVEGLVETLEARQGDRVEKGQPLARLRTYRVKLLLDEARARLREVQARIAKARADVDRAQRLFGDRFISEEELQERVTARDALTQEAHRHRATARILEDRLSRMIIKAPFAGRVISEETEVGQWLDEGEAVVRLADLSEIHVMVPIPEQYLPEVPQGTLAEVAFDALPGPAASGEVSAIVPQADPASRTFPVQISVANPEGRILGGMLARVTFFRHAGHSLLLVPKDAFVPQPDGGGYVVKVDDGTARHVPVRIEETYEKTFAVSPLEGHLDPGDRVVIRGNERTRPGQPVREAGGGA